MGILQKGIREKKIGNGDLILIIICFVAGYVKDTTGPKPYYYKNEIVIIDKKYQCPVYCAVNHSHSVYFEGKSIGMVVEKSELGKRYKPPKKRKKIKQLLTNT